jgi:hypothetical protein
MKKIFLLSLMITLHVSETYAQGCSDAGGCSIQSMQSKIKSDKVEDTLFKNSISLGYGFGLGIKSTKIHNLTLEWQHHFNPTFSMQLRVPYVITQGTLGTYNKLGDFLLAFNYSKKMKEDWTLSLSLGGKLATNQANIKNIDGYSLPMVYQTSLGTFDLIYSVGLSYKTWLLGVAFQQVIHHSNKNNYNDTLWVAEPEGATFPQSNQLKRGNDFIVRFEKKFLLHSFTPMVGVLYLNRLKGDAYLSRYTNEYIIDPGTKGSTLNIYLGTSYAINSKNNLEFLYAQPVINRTVSADGLLRKFVFNLKYTYQF